MGSPLSCCAILMNHHQPYLHNSQNSLRNRYSLHCNTHKHNCKNHCISKFVVNFCWKARVNGLSVANGTYHSAHSYIFFLFRVNFGIMFKTSIPRVFPWYIFWTFGITHSQKWEVMGYRERESNRLHFFPLLLLSIRFNPIIRIEKIWEIWGV